MTTTLASDMAQLNSKLNELSRLTEPEYETSTTVALFQYFDKIYNSSLDTTHFQTLIDGLIQKNYAKLCYPIFRRIHTDVFQTQERWHLAYYLLHSLWNYTDKTNAICSAVVEAQLVPLLIDNLNRENFIRHFSSNDAIRKLFDMIVSILHNIAQVPDLVPNLRDNQCVEVLNRLIRTVGSSSGFLKGISYLTIAYIIRESERTYLNSSNESIPYLVGLLNEAINASDRRSNGLEARELCKGLSKLSVANDNKYKLYSEPKLLTSLLNMLERHSNSQEQIASCTLIWNLIFDEKVCKAYKEHKKLNEILTAIAQTSSNDELRRSASGCLCTLMGGPKSPRSSSSVGNKNVMISYNHDVKHLTKQIKDHLAADGFNVWIDVENMHGNLLDAMSDAIETSSIFLMCLTEKYKDSPSCRLECEYAYKKNKHIIPLLLQANYKPDGWLGIILGNKLYVNYAKKPFETAYSETVAELQATSGRPEKKSTVSPPRKSEAPHAAPSSSVLANERATSPPGALVHLMNHFRIDKTPEPMPRTATNVEKMTARETIHFLNENGLDKFLPIFVDMDGATLTKLFEIKTQAPQFYYTLIKDKWDQNSRTLDQTRDGRSPSRTSGTMAQFLQLTIILDKLADRFTKH